MKKEYSVNLKNTKTLRLSDSAVKNIKYIANLEEINESDIIRKFINESILKYKLNLAFKAYENKNVSICGAANIAGISYKEFIEKMVENNIKIDFSTVGDDISEFVKITKKSSK